ncbi:MAG: L,D-transpeptidase family protein [Sphingomicrobium sp.]
MGSVSGSLKTGLLRCAIAIALVASASACRERAATAAQAQPQTQASQFDDSKRISFPQPQRLEFDDSPEADHSIKSLINVPARLDYGKYVWNDDGVPAGRVWVLVDLSKQTMSVFRDGHEIGTSVVLYGADEVPTPMGRFKVLARLKYHWSSVYDAPMPFTLRLTDDGVAIHGSNVARGAATHGCLGVPEEFAKLLFDQMRVGDEVLVVQDIRSHVIS